MPGSCQRQAAITALWITESTMEPLWSISRMMSHGSAWRRLRLKNIGCCT